MAYTPTTWTDSSTQANAARLNKLEQGVKAAHETADEALAQSGTSGPDIQVGGTQPAEGWWLDNGAPIPDGSAPTTPTGLTATPTGGSTVSLSWTASSDNIGVTGYEYRIGSGAAVDAGPGTSVTASGLSAETAYTFSVRAYDASGNRSGWSATASATTLAGPDTTPPIPGSLDESAVTSTTFTLTVTGASDAIGLHATPYAFSTDNGATWSAWQAGATFGVTGKTPSTAYQARHKVRDAALNEATGTAITVTTSAPAPLFTDTFNRADTSGGDTLGGTWIDPDAHWRIVDNSARVGSVSAAGASAYVDIGTTSARVVGTLRLLTVNAVSYAGVGLAGTPITTGSGIGPSGYRASTRLGQNDVSIGARSDTGTTLPAPTGSPWTLPDPAADGDVVELVVREDGSKALLSLYYNGVAVAEDVAYTNTDRPTGTHALVTAAAQSSVGGIDEITVYPI